MQKLSVVIITCNEADRLGDTLESVRFADEVVVVDSNSTDATVSICRSHGAKVVSRAFDGFGTQKQFALELATFPWVLAIDADERVSPELAESIRKVLTERSDEREGPAEHSNDFEGPAEHSKSQRPAGHSNKYNGYRCIRANHYLGRPILHAGWYPDRRPVLVARDHARFSENAVHERLIVNGRIGDLNGHLLHHSHRSLEDHLRKVSLYGRLWSEEAFRRGRRAGWLDLVFRPAHYLLRRFILNRGFLDGFHGLILCAMGAFHVFYKYACLKELELRSKARKGHNPDLEVEP